MDKTWLWRLLGKEKDLKVLNLMMFAEDVTEKDTGKIVAQIVEDQGEEEDHILVQEVHQILEEGKTRLN